MKPGIVGIERRVGGGPGFGEAEEGSGWVVMCRLRFSFGGKNKKVVRELELFDSIFFQTSDYACVFTMVHILTSTPSICIRGAWSLIVSKVPELLCLSRISVI